MITFVILKPPKRGHPLLLDTELPPNKHSSLVHRELSTSAIFHNGYLCRGGMFIHICIIFMVMQRYTFFLLSFAKTVFILHFWLKIILFPAKSVQYNQFWSIKFSSFRRYQYGRWGIDNSAQYFSSSHRERKTSFRLYMVSPSTTVSSSIFFSINEATDRFIEEGLPR